MERKRHPLLENRLPKQGRRLGALRAGLLTAGVHVLIIAALFFWPRSAPAPVLETPPLTMVSIVDSPKPAPPGPPAPEPAQAAPPKVEMPKPPVIVLLPPVKEAQGLPMPDNSDIMSASEVAGAAGVGEGGGGGGGTCNLARQIQAALRRDPLVRGAVAEARRLGKAIRLWDGDWVRSGEQEGKGLAVLRQAIIWEVAFAPESCRNERMHGLIMLSLADRDTRFGIGRSDWRWADLLGLQRQSLNR